MPGGGDIVCVGPATDDRAALAIFTLWDDSSDVVRRSNNKVAGIFVQVSQVLTCRSVKVDPLPYREKQACLREMKTGSLFVRNEG